MSGFFGIFSPTKKSIDLEAFEQMRKASALDGFDGMETYVEDHIAMGHLMLRVSPESQYDKQPLKSSCGNYILVGHFRLDYRDELGDKLGLVQTELEKTPDSLLVMMAFQKWKEKCVDHLEGDWAFVMYDTNNKSLILAKEKNGFSSLFYTIIGDQLFFSSDLQILSEVHSLNKKINLEQLYRISIPGGTTENGFTLLKDVFNLSASTVLLFDSALTKNPFKNERSIQFVNAKIKYRYIEDYILEFKSIYSVAIKSRFKTSSGPIGLLLSSGLDSSSLAYFTAKELEKKGGFLNTYTSFPYFIDEIPVTKHHLVDESPLVKEYVSQFPNVKASYLNFPDADYMELLSSDLTGDYLNPILTSNTFWVEGIGDLCVESGIRTLFCGQLGNFTVSWDSPYIYGDLFCKGQFLKSLRFLVCYARLKKISITKAIKEKLFAIYYRQLILIFKYFNFRFIYDKKIFSDLSKKLLSDHPELLKTKVGLISGFSFFYNSAKTRKKLVSFYFEHITTRIYTGFSRKKVVFVDPTSDARLIKFLFLIPDELFNYMGEEKFLYKQLMQKEGVLSYIDTNIRRLQSLDIPYRLQQSLDKDRINDMLINVNDYVDVHTIKKTLNKLFEEQGNYMQKRTLSTNLLRKLSLVNFISKNLHNFKHYED